MKGIPGPASPRHCSAHRLESQAPDHITTNLALPVPAHFLSAQIHPLSSRRGPHGPRPSQNRAGAINAHGSSRELPLRLCMAVSVLPSVASEWVGNLPAIRVHTSPPFLRRHYPPSSVPWGGLGKTAPTFETRPKALGVYWNALYEQAVIGCRQGVATPCLCDVGISEDAGSLTDDDVAYGRVSVPKAADRIEGALVELDVGICGHDVEVG